jgi:hypothetical protein
MKAGTESKLKFAGLKRQLKLPFWQVIGVLEAIWHTTLRNAPAGDIGKLSNEEIAAAIEWDGDADELIAALVKARWLDVDTEFRLVVHDWSDHCPNYLKGGYQNGHKKFADVVVRERAKLPSLDGELSSVAKLPSQATSSEGVATNSIQFNPIQFKEGEAAKPLPSELVSKSKNFIPPTIEQVAEYCRERGNAIDPTYFVDKYTGNGWMVGKSKMKDWRATIRTWEKNNFQATKPPAPTTEPIGPAPPIVHKFKPHIIGRD